jgi:hypothetical protein
MPVAVSSLLDRVTGGLKAILGRNFVGIYVYGSLTQRAFRKDYSDVDCVVITHSELTPSQFAKLDAWLAHEASSDPWVKRLQMQFLLRDSALTMDAPAALYQFGHLSRTTSDGNPIIWVNILASGIVLAGPAPRSFIPQISRETLDGALRREIGYLRAEVIDKPVSQWRDVPFYRVYAVLTLCRILYSFHTGVIASKPRAARWALRTLPAKWHSVILKALEPGAHEGSPKLDLKKIGEFIRFVDAQCATNA